MLSVRDLVRDLDVTVRSGDEHLDAPVRWVHISELEDPTPWLSGGELLLTTGAVLQRSIAAQERLQRIVLSERGLDAIVAAISALVGGTALVFDGRGELQSDHAFQRRLEGAELSRRLEPFGLGGNVTALIVQSTVPGAGATVACEAAVAAALRDRIEFWLPLRGREIAVRRPAVGDAQAPALTAAAAGGRLP